MDQFVRDLLAQPAIDAAEEQSLARRSRKGDMAARDALISAGMRSVALHARMRGLSGEDLRDAVQSGAIGLIRAVDRFDPDRGPRLATYAWRWIGAEMTSTRTSERPWTDSDAAIQPEIRVDDDLLSGLSDDLAEVLALRFGLRDPAASPLTRRQVGERLGRTVAQVRTIEAKAMRQLRGRLAKVDGRAPPQ